MIEEAVPSGKNDKRGDVTNVVKGVSNGDAVDGQGVDRSLMESRVACEKCAMEVATARRVFFEEFIGRASPKGRDLLGNLFGAARARKVDAPFLQSLKEYDEALDRYERQLEVRKSVLKELSMRKGEGTDTGEGMKTDILLVAVAYRGMQGDRKVVEHAKMASEGEGDRTLSYLQSVDTWFSRKSRVQQMRFGGILSDGVDLFVGPDSVAGGERKRADARSAADVVSRVALESEAVSVPEHDMPEIGSLHALLAQPQTNPAHLDAVSEVGGVEVVHIGEPPLTAEQIRVLQRRGSVRKPASSTAPVRSAIPRSPGVGSGSTSAVLKKKNAVMAIRSNEHEEDVRPTSGAMFDTRLADLIQWDGFRFREQVTGELTECDLRVEEVLGTVSAGSEELLPHATKAAFESVVLANAKIGLPDDIRSLLAECWEPLAYIRVSDLYDVTRGVVCEAEGVRVELSNRTEDLLRDLIARVESGTEGDLRKVVTGLIDRASVSDGNETLGDLMRNIYAAKIGVH